MGGERTFAVSCAKISCADFANVGAGGPTATSSLVGRKICARHTAHSLFILPFESEIKIILLNRYFLHKLLGRENHSISEQLIVSFVRERIFDNT